MTTPHLIDVEFTGLRNAIACWMLTDPAPTLVDPGPATTVDTLLEKIEAAGVPPDELRHLVITHIHLDHAGAVGTLVRRFPRLEVHVHEDAAPHLVDPERLVASTRRTFGDDHDRLYGEVIPVPADRIRTWRPGDPMRHPVLRPIPTPGHIDHHLSWLREDDGFLFAGDALGLVPHPEGPSHPATPPPTVDLGAWRRTLDELRAIGPERTGVTHFGLHDDPAARCDALEAALDALQRRARAALDAGREEADAEAFDHEARATFAEVLPREHVDAYFDVFSAARDYAGVVRALRKGRV